MSIGCYLSEQLLKVHFQSALKIIATLSPFVNTHYPTKKTDFAAIFQGFVQTPLKRP